MYKRYVNSLKNSFNFTSRSSRRDMLDYTIINVIIIVILQILSWIFEWKIPPDYKDFLGYVQIVYVFFITMSTLAIVVRRFHDINRTGFYSLLFFFPVINVILYIYLLLAKGNNTKKAIKKYGKRYVPIKVIQL